MKHRLLLATLGVIVAVVGGLQIVSLSVKIASLDASNVAAVEAKTGIQCSSDWYSTDQTIDLTDENGRASDDLGIKRTENSLADEVMLLDGQVLKETASKWSADNHPSAREVSFFNDLLDRELEADDIAEDFGCRMEGLFRDKGADEMVRNFAVQHLERFAQERTVRGTWDVDSEEAAAIRAALEDAALEVDNSIGGTAMLALARLSEIDPHVDLRRLSSRSSSLVASPSARLSTRIAAAQLCGLLRVRSALPALRSLASDPAALTPLRLAARYAAGKAGRPPDSVLDPPLAQKKVPR